MANPGYAMPPAQIEYFFTARDAFRTEATYSHRPLGELLAIGLRGSRPELFFHGEVLNVFNQFQLCGCGETVFNNGGVTNLTTIGQSVASARRRSIPTRRSRSKGSTGIRTRTSGQPLNTFAFTTPRLFRFSVGVRF